MSRIRFIAPALAGTAIAFAVLVVAKQKPGRTEPVSTRPVPTDTILRPTAKGEFNVRKIGVQGTRYSYQVFVPRHYDARKRWPLILSLHGSAERGRDNLTQLSEGLAPVVREQADSFPAIVVFPQIPHSMRGSEFAPIAMDMLHATMREFNANPRRVYLTGISFGGATAYSMAYSEPETFAAVVPVAAPIMSGWMPGLRGRPSEELYADVAQRLKGVPMWLFHGADDSSAPVADARRLAHALETAGVAVHYTEYPGVGHNSWVLAYRSPELFTWLFAQHR
jgi:predicted peptidase